MTDETIPRAKAAADAVHAAKRTASDPQQSDDPEIQTGTPREVRPSPQTDSPRSSAPDITRTDGRLIRLQSGAELGEVELEEDGLPPALPKVKRNRQRKGKSSNKKEWRQTCLYVRHWTVKTMMRYLEDYGTGEDFSEWVDKTAVAWLKKNGITNPDWESVTPSQSASGMVSKVIPPPFGGL